MEWIKGTPPEFKERTWIIAQVPARLRTGAFMYQTFVWDMVWSYGDMSRVTQWAILPLPEEERK